MSSNYPPGVTASDLPGFVDVDVTIPLNCDSPALWVRVDGLNAALERVRKVLQDDGARISRGLWKVAVHEALVAINGVDGFARGDGLGTMEECSFDGEVDGVRGRGSVRADCPTCGWFHEIPVDPETGVNGE